MVFWSLGKTVFFFLFFFLVSRPILLLFPSRLPTRLSCVGPCDTLPVRSKLRRYKARWRSIAALSREASSPLVWRRLNSRRVGHAPLPLQNVLPMACIEGNLRALLNSHTVSIQKKKTERFKKFVDVPETRVVEKIVEVPVMSIVDKALHFLSIYCDSFLLVNL